MTDDIAVRLKDYFTRQIAWCESVLASLGDSDDEETGVGAQISETNLAHERQLDALTSEFWVLKKEWDATVGDSDARRAEIRRLAEQAEAAVREIEARMAEIVRRAESESKKVLDELGALRQGRDMLDKYRVGDADRESFVDRQA